MDQNQIQELLWNAPNGAEYGVQILSGTRWVFLYLAWPMSLNEANARVRHMQTQISQPLRIVKISRYFPDGREDDSPLVQAIVKNFIGG